MVSSVVEDMQFLISQTIQRKILRCGNRLDLGLERLTDVTDPDIPARRLYTDFEMKEKFSILPSG